MLKVGTHLTDHSISRARARPGETPVPPLIETAETFDATFPTTPQKPIKVPLKGDGGRSPPRSNPRHHDFSDTESTSSDHLSVMSFAFKGSEQVKPVLRSKAGRSSLPPNHGQALQRRPSGGYIAGTAANAKFANRLRSTDDNDPTVRPSSRTRKSLPPAMASKPALTAANVNGRTTPVKPPWNASTAPMKPPPTPSVRATKGTITPSTNGGRRLSRGEMTPGLLEDTSVAGVWTAYQDRERETPIRRTGRQLGGMI